MSLASPTGPGAAAGRCPYRRAVDHAPPAPGVPSRTGLPGRVWGLAGVEVDAGPPAPAGVDSGHSHPASLAGPAVRARADLALADPSPVGQPGWSALSVSGPQPTAHVYWPAAFFSFQLGFQS